MKIFFVNERPESLEKGDYVIDVPNFLNEITMHKAKAPKNGMTGSYHLRVIADSIAQKYDSENMSAFSIKPHLFEGRVFTSDAELNSIIVEMMQLCYPKIFAKYIEYSIKNRPNNVKRLIVVRSMIKDETVETICFNYGMVFSNEEEVVATVEPQKSKKVVGKPAITKEQAEQLRKQNAQNT